MKLLQVEELEELIKALKLDDKEDVQLSMNNLKESISNVYKTIEKYETDISDLSISLKLKYKAFIKYKSNS